MFERKKQPTEDRTETGKATEEKKRDENRKGENQKVSVCVGAIIKGEKFAFIHKYLVYIKYLLLNRFLTKANS